MAGVNAASRSSSVSGWAGGSTWAHGSSGGSWAASSRMVLRQWKLIWPVLRSINPVLKM